jgi:hypothetical protein
MSLKMQHRQQDAASRLARSRDRNREHARRTRIRKKAQLAALQIKVARLEAERVTLRQSIEECSIAGILLGLQNRAGSASAGKEDDDDDDIETQTLLENSTSSTKVALLANGKRKRFLEHEDDDESTHKEKQPSQPLKMIIDGKTTLVGGGRSHINWKTGIYNDHSGLQRQFTPVQLENLRYVLRKKKLRLAMLSCLAFCLCTYSH